MAKEEKGKKLNAGLLLVAYGTEATVLLGHCYEIRMFLARSSVSNANMAVLRAVQGQAIPN